jgi:hypothetical protein
MSRLRTIGFEVAGVSATAGAETLEGLTLNTVTVETTTVRSGARSLKYDSGAGVETDTTHNITTVLGRTYFLRAYLNFPVLPASNLSVMILAVGTATVGATVVLTTTGTLQLWAGGAQRGSDSGALSTGTWYMVEVSLNIGSGSVDSCELRLAGASVASATALGLSDSAITNFRLGAGVTGLTAASFTLYVDDVALNDDQGASQSSWPGDGKIVALRPTSDNAVGTGWVDGDGAGTLFGSVENNPPAGTTTPADGTQIKNLTSTTTGNYDANMTTYTAAGLAAGDTVTLVQAVCDHGEGIATNTKLGALQIVSNPAQAVEDGFTYGDDVGGVGAWPNNWRGFFGIAQVAPSVTLGTAPVLRVGKRTASTREVEVDLMAIMVEYVPAAPSFFRDPMMQVSMAQSPYPRGF